MPFLELLCVTFYVLMQYFGLLLRTVCNTQSTSPRITHGRAHQCTECQNSSGRDPRDSQALEYVVSDRIRLQGPGELVPYQAAPV
jgi:hypothetical protein